MMTARRLRTRSVWLTANAPATSAKRIAGLAWPSDRVSRVR